MTQRTPTTLQNEVDTLLADNTTRSISEADVRSVHTDTVDSVFFLNTHDSSDITGADYADFQKFISLDKVIATSAGTWTTTRVAQGDYALRHTAADDTTIIGIDITPEIKTTASRGFKLASVDFIYSVGTAALDAHSATLDRIEYVDNVAVSVNAIATTGALATATQANPYVTNVTVDTPAFNVTADSKYIVEQTVDAAATSDFDFIGLNLRFTRNDL